jgi:hypothetical protein
MWNQLLSNHLDIKALNYILTPLNIHHDNTYIKWIPTYRESQSKYKNVKSNSDFIKVHATTPRIRLFIHHFCKLWLTLEAQAVSSTALPFHPTST